MSKPGAKKLDQIVSATPGDVHIIMIPTPGGPVPTPIPHPCASIIKDDVATKVKVMGQPGAVKGSQSSHTPPHVPMGPGPFQKPPKNKGKIITGSANVFYEGKEAAMLGDTAEMCSDPSDTPVGKVMGTAATVLVGGGGSGSDEAREKASADAMKAAQAAAAAMQQVTATGHPVDVATGNLIVGGADFELDGPLPIEFARTYCSAQATQPSAMGFGWSHNFEESVEVIGPSHRRWQPVHQGAEAIENPSPNNLYIAYRDPNGLSTSYHLPDDGQVVDDPFHRRRIARHGGTFVLTNQAGISTHFEVHEGSGTAYLPTRRVDRNGNEVRFFYDRSARLLRVEDCYERSLTLNYDKHDRVIELQVCTIAQGDAERWCAYRYDESGDLVEVVDRVGATQRFAYAEHLIVEDRDRQGYAFYFAYDAQRRCVQTWGQDGYLTRTLRLDPAKHRTRVINGEGEMTLYTCTGSGVVRRIDRGHLYTEFTFDDAGRLTSRSNGGGIVTALEYDKDGNVAVMTDAEGHATECAYNAFGQVVSLRNPLGQESTFRYDGRGNMVRSVGPAGIVTTYRHDARGRVVEESQSGIAPVRLKYDRFGHVEQTSHGAVVTRFRYDPLGNLLHRSKSGEPTTEYTWNRQGLVEKVRVGDVVTASLGYDAEGRVIEHLDDNGLLHRYLIKTGALVSEATTIDTRHGTGQEVRTRIRYQLDREGRIAGTEDHLGRKGRVVFDELGRVQCELLAGGRRREFEYDEACRVSVIRCGADVQRYSHDGRGLPVSVEYADGSTDRFEYDEVGRPLRLENEWGSVEYEYDAFGRQCVRRQGEFALRASIHDGTLAWSQDGEELTRSVHGPTGLVEEVGLAGRAIALKRNEHGNLVARRLPNGLSETYQADAYGRQLGYRLAKGERLLVERAVSYSNGKISRIDDSERGASAFEYDDRGGLRKVVGAHAEFYERDRWDNLRSSHRYSESTVLSEDQLASAGARSYSYDPMGRVCRIHVGDRRYLLEYNSRSQLARVSLPDGGTVDYTYDPLGRRVEKRFAGGARHGRRIQYRWARDQVVGEQVWQDDQPALERLYLFSGLAPLMRVDRSGGNDRAFYYHVNHVGQPTHLSDERGEIVWRWRGDRSGFVAGDGDGEQNLRLPGQYYDEETGLCFNRYRYFDPWSSRYLQPDPIEKRSSVSRYAYPCDPLTEIDPLGLETMILVADPSDPVLGGGTLRDGSQHEGSTARLLRGNKDAKSSNLFDTKSQIADLSGVDHVIINAHGTPNSIQYTDHIHRAMGETPLATDGKRLARLLKARGFKGSKVTIVACNTGKTDTGMAQSMADELGGDVEVVAPSRSVSVSADGSLHVSDNGVMRTFKAGAAPTPSLADSADTCPDIRIPAGGGAAGPDETTVVVSRPDSTTVVRPAPAGPDETTVVRSRPDSTTVVDRTVPDATVPDATVPDATVPDGTVPDGGTPGGR